MDLLIDTFLALGCFAVLLASGSWAFGAGLGGLARGAVVPLLVLPLLSDWLRFLGKLSFTTSFGLAGGLYLLAAALIGLRRPRVETAAAGSKWWLALVVLIVIHVLFRLWIVSERGPNPGDDTFAGYKAQALFHSPSWPTIHPEAPDLPISYYYYGYAWPAALAALGVSLKAGWWVTALVLCVTGGMLVLEVVLPKLQHRRDVLLATLTVALGCSWSVIFGLILRLPPRSWLQEASYLTTRYGLYMRLPDSVGSHWAPFNLLATGILFSATIVLLEQIRQPWSARRFVFVTLAIGSLAGYCTFHLIGFVLIVVPGLTVFAWRQSVPGTLKRWVVSLAALGLASALTTLPLLLDLAQRQTATRYDRFRDPLLVWLQTAFTKFSVLEIAGLGLWTLAAIALTNILLFPLLPRLRAGQLEPRAVALLGVFGFGILVCLFGVTDDFVPKFGFFVATTLVAAFLSSGPWPAWARWVWLSGLVVPVLLLANTVRANLTSPRWDRIWHALDQTAGQTGEIVLYDLPFSERRTRTPWQNLMPYFSRARLLVPAGQVDDQGQNFLRDPAELAKLPPTEVRLSNLAGSVPTYLLLTEPSRPVEGEELYRSEIFSLRRLPRAPAAPAATNQ